MSSSKILPISLPHCTPLTPAGLWLDAAVTGQGDGVRQEVAEETAGSGGILNAEEVKAAFTGVQMFQVRIHCMHLGLRVIRCPFSAGLSMPAPGSEHGPVS